MSRTVIERWAAESHSACIPIARCKGSIGFDQHGFALNVGPLTALAIWGIPLEAAKLLAIETASLAGLLSALSLSRFIENHLIDKGAHERLRLMYDGVNAS